MDPKQHEANIWKLFAFIGRYGHQQFTTLYDMTTRELTRVVDELAEMIEHEAPKRT